jgi:hypothetical protein
LVLGSMVTCKNRELCTKINKLILLDFFCAECLCIIAWIQDRAHGGSWFIIGCLFQKYRYLSKTIILSMSKADSLFKWPFMPRLLGLGRMGLQLAVPANGGSGSSRAENPPILARNPVIRG